MMRTANPALNAKTFDVANEGAEVMTIQGAVSRTAMLLALLFAATLLTWKPTAPQDGTGLDYDRRDCGFCGGADYDFQ